MAEVLCVTWDGGGNVPPMLGVAGELRRRGHDVRFLGHAQQRSRIEGAGFAFEAYTSARPWSSTAPDAGPGAAARIFAMFTDPGPGRDLLASVARQPADLLLIDCMSLGALQAADRDGLRRAVLVHTYHRFLTHLWSRGPVGLVARVRGQRPRRLWAAADLVLVATDRDLDPAEDRDLPANTRHVGVVQAAPLPGGSPSTSADVLVSLSTTFFPGQDRALQSILDGLAGLPVRAVLTTGEAVDPARLRAPANVEVHRYLDHADVLPHVRLVIGHGGHATTMRALSHDLPLLVLPMHPMLDQKMIGQSVERAGAGRVLPKTASAQQIREAVGTLLEPGPHVEAAAKTGARVRSRDGAVVAGDLLADLLP